MKRKKRPELDAEYVGVNPFTQSLSIPVNKVESGYTATGDVHEVELDSQPHYKTFYSRELRLKRVGLKYRAGQLLDWIMHSIDSGSDVIWIDVPRYMRECGIANDKTYRAAIAELWEAGYIAPCAKVKHAYFINPAYVFKGSRINKYPDKIQYV